MRIELSIFGHRGTRHMKNLFPVRQRSHRAQFGSYPKRGFRGVLPID